MNYENPHTRLTRCRPALAAILVTTLLGTGIDGLAKHYRAESMQFPLKPVLLAKR